MFVLMTVSFPLNEAWLAFWFPTAFGDSDDSDDGDDHRNDDLLDNQDELEGSGSLDAPQITVSDPQPRPPFDMVDYATSRTISGEDTAVVLETFGNVRWNIELFCLHIIHMVHILLIGLIVVDRAISIQTIYLSGRCVRWVVVSSKKCCLMSK